MSGMVLTTQGTVTLVFFKVRNDENKYLKISYQNIKKINKINY